MLDSTRLFVLSGLSAWAGATLLLSQRRWFSRLPLYLRLQRFSGRTGIADAPMWSTFREVITPLATSVGERLSRIFGANEDLAARLRRAHLDDDVAAFRLRQLGWMGATLGLGTAICVATQPPLPLLLLILVGGPILAFLFLEQNVTSAASARSRRLFSELPVFSEQVAMLLGAGYSLGAVLNRLSIRGHGVIAQDLVGVCERIRHGLTVEQALREWGVTAHVPELQRLVDILAFNSNTNDLGRLVSNEARAIRREAQRRLVEIMERRGQQVWIPVTVATLVPGVIFLMIPFLNALQLFTGN